MCSPELRQQIEAFVSIATCGRMRACISSPIYLWIGPVRFVAGTVGDFFPSSLVKPKMFPNKSWVFCSSDAEADILPAFSLRESGSSAGNEDKCWYGSQLLVSRSFR